MDILYQIKSTLFMLINHFEIIARIGSVGIALVYGGRISCLQPFEPVWYD